MEQAHAQLARRIHGTLAKQNTRLFYLVLDGEATTFVHISKTVRAWRSDVKSILSEVQGTADQDGHAGDEVRNTLFSRLRDAGYVEVTDVVSDVYEGRIATESASIVDDPDHECQADGFGHYGWESKDGI